jgi:SNF2 family DNA or RNA helicase
VEQRPTVDLKGRALLLTFPYDKASVDAVRLINAAYWDKDIRAWVIPYSQAALGLLKRIFPDIQYGGNLKTDTVNAALTQTEAAERKYLPEVRDVEIKDFEFATQPYMHQKISFNFARSLPCSGLFLEQGLGKSKVYIDLATWRFRMGQIRRSLLVCPNSVLPVWGEQISIHGGKDFKKYVILEGSSRQKLLQCSNLIAEKFTGFVIVNYDALLNMYETLLEMQEGPDKLFDQMGLDESSRVKHATAKRSKICWKLGLTVPYRNILTGTPITQSLEDIFSQYRFLDQRVFGPYSTAFRGQYLIMGGFEMRQIIGYRNVEDAIKKIYALSIRFTGDRCLDLPPKVYEVRHVRMDEDTSKRYKQLEKECVAEFGGAQVTAPMVMTKIMKLSQITGGFVYEQGADGSRVATHRMAKMPKIEVLREVLEENPGRKVIIWCRFMEELNLIQEALREDKLKYVVISGGVTVRGKAEKGAECKCGTCRGCLVRQFQTDPNTRVFLGQVSTAGLGITLTAASLVIYYSNTYSLEDRLQSEDRCHRIGQTKSVTYVDILAETSMGGKTIDHDTLEILKGKGRFANEISRALMQKMVERTKGSKLEEGLAAFVQEEKKAGTYKGIIRNPARTKKRSKGSDMIMEEGEEF